MTIVRLPNGNTGDNPTFITSTDALIIGTGPAGASLACFLAYYGILNMMPTVNIKMKCSHIRS
jgi:alkyl hydroperoxide reductase subunit AhpF